MYLTYLLGTKKNGGVMGTIQRSALAMASLQLYAITASVVAINYTEV